MSNGRILFIDAYDSFSNNIITLLKDLLPVSVEVIKIDDLRFVLNDDAFYKFLIGFDAVVAGPGPGHPCVAADIGLISKVWGLPNALALPVLGICLGFQSLCLAFGAAVDRLREPRHGMVTPVLHCGQDIFQNTGEIVATQYHSLHVKLADGSLHTDPSSLWLPSRSCKELIPLAWDLSDKANGPILMAAQHCYKPLWGVQYHPESICTNGEGRKLVANWWREVCAGRPMNLEKMPSTMPSCNGALTNGRFKVLGAAPQLAVQWTSIRLPSQVETVDIANLLREDCSNCEPILVESGVRNGRPINAETGRFSIIGVHDSSSSRIRYSTASHQLEVVAQGEIVKSRSVAISDVFEFLEEFIEDHRAVNGLGHVPFWGGLVGFISYEAGLETIAVAPPPSNPEHPDIWFVFIERSVVVDHVSSMAYVQSIRESDERWLSSFQDNLRQLMAFSSSHVCDAVTYAKDATITSSPQAETYRNKVSECQDHLRAGSSYELCLTDKTKISSPLDSWEFYLRLRYLNPAPFGAYLQLPPCATETGSAAPSISIVSSSPERFLSWSRDGTCQFRPIKGTVKKVPGMTRAEAEELLSSPKERAENLMIVDLIRHDLSSVPG